MGGLIVVVVGGEGEELAAMGVAIFDDVDVGADVRFGDADLGIEGRDDEELKAKLLEEVESVLGVLIIAAREHLIDHDEVEALIEIAIGVEVILVGDCGDEDEEGEFSLFATGLTGSTVVVAFGITGGGDEFSSGKVEPVADIGDFFAPAKVVFIAKFADQFLDAEEGGFIGFGREIEGTVEAVGKITSEVQNFAIEDVGGLESHVGARFPFEQA